MMTIFTFVVDFVVRAWTASGKFFEEITYGKLDGFTTSFIATATAIWKWFRSLWGIPKFIWDASKAMLFVTGPMDTPFRYTPQNLYRYVQFLINGAVMFVVAGFYGEPPSVVEKTPKAGAIRHAVLAAVRTLGLRCVYQPESAFESPQLNEVTNNCKTVRCHVDFFSSVNALGEKAVYSYSQQGVIVKLVVGMRSETKYFIVTAYHGIAEGARYWSLSSQRPERGAFNKGRIYNHFNEMKLMIDTERDIAVIEVTEQELGKATQVNYPTYMAAEFWRIGTGTFPYRKDIPTNVLVLNRRKPIPGEENQILGNWVSVGTAEQNEDEEFFTHKCSTIPGTSGAGVICTERTKVPLVYGIHIGGDPTNDRNVYVESNKIIFFIETEDEKRLEKSRTYVKESSERSANQGSESNYFRQYKEPKKDQRAKELKEQETADWVKHHEGNMNEHLSERGFSKQCATHRNESASAVLGNGKSPHESGGVSLAPGTARILTLLEDTREMEKLRENELRSRSRSLDGLTFIPALDPPKEAGQMTKENSPSSTESSEGKGSPIPTEPQRSPQEQQELPSESIFRTKKAPGFDSVLLLMKWRNSMRKLEQEKRGIQLAHQENLESHLCTLMGVTKDVKTLEEEFTLQVMSTKGLRKQHKDTMKAICKEIFENSQSSMQKLVSFGTSQA
jgi:V8-like Glu-specific endopeptidase